MFVVAYFQRVFSAFRHWHLTLVETVLLFSLLGMCLVSAITAQTGRNIGDAQALHVAKMKAQESLMALMQKP
jgi:hypothetical protein